MDSLQQRRASPARRSSKYTPQNHHLSRLQPGSQERGHLSSLLADGITKLHQLVQNDDTLNVNRLQ
jgi:hypothetical protein